MRPPFVRKKHGQALLLILVILGVLALAVIQFSGRNQVSNMGTAITTRALDSNLLSATISGYLKNDCPNAFSAGTQKYDSRTRFPFPVSLTLPGPQPVTLVTAGTVSNAVQVQSIEVDGTNFNDIGPEGSADTQYSGDECLTGNLRVVVTPAGAPSTATRENNSIPTPQATLNFPMNFYTSNHHHSLGVIVGCNGGFPPCLSNPSPSPSHSHPPCLAAGSICDSHGRFAGCDSPPEAGNCRQCCSGSTAECVLNPSACAGADPCTRSQYNYFVCN